MPRELSGFVEAQNIKVAASGGVKKDPVNPSGDNSKGYGNVTFTSDEFVSRVITASFKVDLAHLRG